MNSVNVIIPSITVSNELIKCLRGLNKINYKNFFVTIVIDYENKRKIPKFKFKLNKLIVGKIFMSKKRNLASKKFKSEYIAFIDSDCYPSKNWLKKSVELLKIKPIHVVGGPNISFQKQTYSEDITSNCKKSIFISGHLAYRKFKSPERYCDDYLESCNLIMKKKFFLGCGGMNEKVYISEDKILFEDLRKKYRKFKAFYSPEIFVYHKQRTILKFLLQRLSYGTALLSSVSLKIGFKGLVPAFPIIGFFLLLFFLSTNLSFNIKFFFVTFLILLINFFIYFEIKKSVFKINDKLHTLLIINLCNVMHIMGSLITILGLRKLCERKIYVLSRSNE